VADAEDGSGSQPPSTIKSRPQYPGLHAVATARHNVVAANAEGVVAVLRMLTDAPPGFAERTHVVHAGTDDSSADDLARLRALGTHRLDVVPSTDEALRLLDGVLATATMSTRLYAAGTEGFIGRVVTLAIGHGMDHKSVLTEHSGSRARRVQCVHCKHITEDVTVSIFECAGCGVLLFVRDHYSRRLAAFQGVCANAEDLSERPVPEEAYA
jgi:dimethylamine monooxygenase subunit C